MEYSISFDLSIVDEHFLYFKGCALICFYTFFCIFNFIATKAFNSFTNCFFPTKLISKYLKLTTQRIVSVSVVYLFFSIWFHWNHPHNQSYWIHSLSKIQGPPRTLVIGLRKITLVLNNNLILGGYNKKNLNTFSTNVPLLYPLKTSENQRFFDVFRG